MGITWQRLIAPAKKAARFIARQTHNFRLMLLRRALHAVATNLTLQYNSIYATLLGANSMQLGSLQSVGSAIGALASVPAGWFIDYYSLKNVFLIGMALMAASGLVYGLAPHWAWLYLAIVLASLGMRVACTACSVTCAAELSNQERATGRGFCRTISSLLTLVTPLLAAWGISTLGGISARSIRPLYIIQAVLFVAILGLLWVTFRYRPADRDKAHRRAPLLSGLTDILKQSPDVVRLVLVVGLMELPWSMSQPFTALYAHQFKGADEFLLGGISTAITLVPMLTSIPLGRLADRYGRKRILFAIAPLGYLANLALVFAPASGLAQPVFLLSYGILFGFHSMAMALASAMTAEIMPKEQMGRWIGMVSLFRGLLSIPAPLIGGAIWDYVGPQYVFFAAIAIDILLRLPLLSSIRETLNITTAKK